jgi:hypothetical protein
LGIISNPPVAPALPLYVCVIAVSLLPAFSQVEAQELTGVIVGRVEDQHGGALRDADVRVSSPALIGGSARTRTSEKGQLRFPSLTPGVYALTIAMPGFRPYQASGIRVSPGGTIELHIVMQLAAVSESVVVEALSPGVEARDSGFATRFRDEELRSIPTRRAGMFDSIRAAPGVSPTSPSSGTTTTVSIFGSGTNENQFQIDGTPTTCPCNGIARADIGIDFIQEVHVQSLIASAEFGSLQGGVINVVTRQGADRFQYDASYYGQWNALTSQPVSLPVDPDRPESGHSGYTRGRYRDATTNLGGPLLRNRAWFFVGYQYLRDYDNQPGTDPREPRTYEQDKFFTKLTWKLGPAQLLQSLHYESWVNPDTPTIVTPFEATRRRSAKVPAMTPAHLTYVVSPATVWDARIGRFIYDEERTPSTGDWTQPSSLNRATNVTTGAPPLLGGLKLIRTSAKSTISRFQPALLGADHQWKLGVQFERGEQIGANIVPTGVRYVHENGRPLQSISSAPSNIGGLFVTASSFLSDAITIGNRLTLNAGVRFDYTRAISQDVPALDSQGQETGETIDGLGTMYTWNVWSPRLGATARLTNDGRTMLRASYGRFSQGVFTGELTPFHPGVTPVTTMAFETATGGYTRFVRTVDARKNLGLDPDVRPPSTNEYALAIDREIGRELAVAVTYIHKDGDDFIGWTDIGGQYRQDVRPLPDGRLLPVFVLVNSPNDQLFALTNPDGYSLRYNGLALTAEKRRSNGWQLSGSYTWSRASGLQASSGELASGAQASTVATPTRVFGRDPNDLTNAHGRLPNDRPHMLRVMGSFDVARTGLMVAANLQHFNGKPWAASTQMDLQQLDQRILLEPRGTRRLSSQTLLDLRVSKAFTLRAARIDLLLDVLNVLNDTAEEALATDNFYSPTFGQPTVFMDPRRAMIGVRLNLNQSR